MRGVVAGSTLPSYIHGRFSTLPCTGLIFRVLGDRGLVSRETYIGGVFIYLAMYRKINLVVYGEGL
jgi:hypothetical protein